jgi:FKBP-type peptidyl-prolyl cis-trans isomerase FkpA
MNFKNALIFSLFTFFLIGCKKDDNGVEITPPLPIGEVYQTNSADIEAFMATHTYNYSDFDNPAVDFDFKVKIEIWQVEHRLFNEHRLLKSHSNLKIWG